MRKFLPLLLMVSVVHGCTEPDNSEPILQVLNLSPSVADGVVCGELESNVINLSSSDQFEITFRVTDDKELSQFKIDLHNNFDCHGHAGKVETTDWFVIDIGDLTGADETIERTLTVPADVTTGSYHFTIQATDAAGNSAETAIFSLNVSNSGDVVAPVLNVTDPATQNFSVQKGSSLNFAGTLTDNNPLGGGTNGRLEVVFWEISNQTEVDLYEEEFNNSLGDTYNFNFSTTVPITTADGTYIFEVRAFDAINNPSSTVQFTVEVF